MAYDTEEAGHADTGLGSLNRVSTGAMRHQVRETLRQAILDGTLKPGERLVESALARQLGVSETPVREAIRELENAGLVITYPHRATFVRTYTREELSEMYSLRAHLERLAVRLAISRLSPEDHAQLQALVEEMLAYAQEGDVAAIVEADVSFHAYVVERSGHALLARTWRSINPPNSTSVTVVTLAERPLEFHAERHKQLLDVLHSSDVNRAEDVFERHILDVSTEVLGHIHDDGSAGT